MKMGHLCRTKTIARFVPITHMRYVPKVRPMLQLGALFSLTLFIHFTHTHTHKCDDDDDDVITITTTS